MSVIKVIKIGLPVATATSAAIATTSLVSFRKKDKLSKEEEKDLDKSIDDLKLPDEKYQDAKLFYSKDGTGKNHKVLDPEIAEKLAKLLKEKSSLDDVGASIPDAKLPTNLDIEKLIDSGHKPSDASKGDGQEETRSTTIPSDEGDVDRPKNRGLQTKTDLSDQIVSSEIKEKGTENKSPNKEPLSGEGEEQSGGPVQHETLDDKDLKQGSLDKSESEEGKGLATKDSSFEASGGTGDLDSSGDDDDENQEEEDGLSSGAEKQVEDDQKLSMPVQQSQDSEIVDNGQGENGSKTSEVNGENDRPSTSVTSVVDRVDPSGKKENLTDEDIKRWSSVEAEISSVVDELQALINI